MKVILWLQSPQLPLLNQAINVVAKTYGALEFVGAIVQESARGGVNSITINNQVIPSLDKDKIAELEYDIVIVGGFNVSMPAVLKEAKTLGLDEDKIVLDRTVCVPGFTLEKYKMLRHSRLSILSWNCWGGLIYHLFGLPFNSPTINMLFDINGFLKMLHTPKYYFDKELRFYTMTKGHFYNKTWDYPIFLLGDVKIDMIHYNNIELNTVENGIIDIAREKWEARRLKINWYNLLVAMYATDPKVLEEFDQLPFAKKVCFVPFETNLPPGYYIPPKFAQGISIEEAANRTAHNTVQCFDLWDMLLYGKKTPINQ